MEDFMKRRITEEKKMQRNAEGYPDPTAYDAISKVERDSNIYSSVNPAADAYERDRFMKVVGCILRICELSGFHLEEKLVLKDKRTGKIWY